MKTEEFNYKLFAIPNDEIIETAKTQLSKLCVNSDKNFTMCVPVRLDDTDIIYSEIIRRLENESTKIKELIEAYDEYVEFLGKELSRHEAMTIVRPYMAASDVVITKGVELRAKIENLKTNKK